MTDAFAPTALSCATCGVECGAEQPEVCPICADERQWVPATGQAWVSQAELAAAGSVRIDEFGPGLWGVTAAGAGIGQTMKVIGTEAGVVLWDPVGLVDTSTVEFLRRLGPVRAIVASHPHMYGAQVTWSRALGDAPVLVHRNDAEWVQRADDVIEQVHGRFQLTDDLELITLGGHFPGSTVLHWPGGAGGCGVMLAGDTIMVNPDLRTTSFLRSYPNRIPLSGKVVDRMMGEIDGLAYEQIWSNFTIGLTAGADRLVAASARRHIGWVRGEFDELT